MISRCLEGRPGTSYRLEFTTEFEHWHSMGEYTTEDGDVQFIDPDANGHEQRCHRLVEAVDELRAEVGME